MPEDARGRFYSGSENRSEADVASAARTTTGTGTAFNTDDIVTLVATLVISAASGTTPTLDLTLQTSADGGTSWQTVAAFAQQTGTTAGVWKVFGPMGSTCRWSWVIGGTTPSFTFAVSTTDKRAR